MRTKTVLAAMIAALVVVGAACGSGDSSDSAGSSDSTESSGADDSGPIEMTNVATGETETLSEALAPSDGKPTIAWFWAPYCPTCRGEAPALDEFMAQNSDRVNMVGIGSRNDLKYAEGFLEDTGVTNFPLLWEPTGRSWVENAVAAQPYAILIAPDGEEVQRWPGGASITQINQALAELA